MSALGRPAGTDRLEKLTRADETWRDSKARFDGSRLRSVTQRALPRTAGAVNTRPAHHEQERRSAALSRLPAAMRLWHSSPSPPTRALRARRERDRTPGTSEGQAEHHPDEAQIEGKRPATTRARECPTSTRLRTVAHASPAIAPPSDRAHSRPSADRRDAATNRRRPVEPQTRARRADARDSTRFARFVQAIEQHKASRQLQDQQRIAK